jgi:hypothetical protein
MARNPTVCINFQTDAKMRDDLHAMARQQERSASALIRLAVRALLESQKAKNRQREVVE